MVNKLLHAVMIPYIWIHQDASRIADRLNRNRIMRPVKIYTSYTTCFRKIALAKLHFPPVLKS